MIKFYELNCLKFELFIEFKNQMNWNWFLICFSELVQTKCTITEHRSCSKHFPCRFKRCRLSKCSEPVFRSVVGPFRCRRFRATHPAHLHTSFFFFFFLFSSFSQSQSAFPHETRFFSSFSLLFFYCRKLSTLEIWFNLIYFDLIWLK